MGSIRVERVREKIKFEVARILQTEVKDPRMGFITVIDCDLTADMRYATVKVSVLADREGEINRVMKMLEDARGFIQRTVGSRLHTRLTPELRFELDRGAEKSVQISSLLDDLRREREEREATQAEDGGDPDEAEASGGGAAGEPEPDED